MNLHTRGALGLIGMPDFIAANKFPGRSIELVVVDLEGSQGGVEGEFDVRRPRRELKAGHGCGNREFLGQCHGRFAIILLDSFRGLKMIRMVMFASC